MGCCWRSCSQHLCPCVNRQRRPTPDNPGPLSQRPSTTVLMEDSNRGFQSRAVLEGPGPSTCGNELGLRAQSPESLEDTLEPDCLDDDSSFTSSTSGSSTQQEMVIMWGRVVSSLIGLQLLHNSARNIHSHVYVARPDMEDEGHCVLGFIENPETMEGEAKVAGPHLVLGDAPSQISPPPPPERELELERPAMATPGHQPLVAPQPAPPTELLLTLVVTPELPLPPLPFIFYFYFMYLHFC
uniref:uncharacterized protein LOC120884226 n=1 Tax=Ictidomys tridecemlineatus TaxID=43179 RepID=UPI001A9D015E|nr:uncharacterized protein LOC120884226 [Ictidomys tridecemlineatus]